MTALTKAPPTALKITVVAILYILCGRLGMFLAVPPGYATVIWPASGLAVGALLAHGRSLWPGVFIGSFALNAAMGGAYTQAGGWEFAKLAIAAAIAAGSTAQSLAAYRLVGRALGSPIDLRSARDVLKLFVLAAPLSCLIAPTVGVASLSLGGVIAPDDAARNWLTWWLGDVLGIVVFLPLVLIAPGARNKLAWRGAPLGALPVAAIIVLLLPLGLTFYAWKASSEYNQERGRAVFAATVARHEEALFHRLATYQQGLLGAVGFIKGSDQVTAAEWRTYIDAIDVAKNFPGVGGIGFIRKVEPEDLAAFLTENRKERPAFAIHPEAPGRPNFIIEHLEPLAENSTAIGLNIAFEENRLQAAALARDSGRPAITRRIALVQDRTRGIGFLLLHPLFRSDVPIDTVEQRRAALVGWVYAPFITSDFMRGLSGSWDEVVGLRVHDGEEPAAETLIYDGAAGGADASPAFSLRRSVAVLQQTWTLDWTSTPAFERSVRSEGPLLILGGGLIFTALFGALLFLFAHRADTIRALVDVRTRELAESEARYREAVDSAQDAILSQLAEGVIVTDAAGRITLVNGAAAAIHGVERLDVEPNDYSATYHLFTESGDPYPPHDLALARAVRGETVTDARWLVRRPDGAEVLAIGSARPLRNRDGEQVGSVLTLRDDTAREAAEAALRELNATLSERVAERTREAESARAEAERASAAKTDFLASMSHEIRTPLNGILGYTDLLLDEPAIGPSVRRHGERIRDAGAALLTVVNDVLDFSKIEAGQVELDPRAFSLPELVDTCLSIVAGAVTGKDVALRTRLDPSLPPTLVGDPDRLRQVLLNLLNNAAKFTSHGHVELVVEKIGEAGDRVALRMAVTDTGIGIPQDRLGSLFERFSQVDGSISRRFGGTGLGLAISKRLVVLMGGCLTVESREGRGSTFALTLTLPVGKAADDRGGGSASIAATRGDAPGRPARVLLAEDLDVNQELARMVLERAGHSVDIVSDGAQAVQAIQRSSYDVVLMDVQMPVMDGLEATRRIRGLAGTERDIPIVALTANVLPEQITRFKDAGMCDHVGKPFKRDALVGAVERWAFRKPGGVPVPDRVDRAAFDDLMLLLGPERVRGLLASLAKELDARFVQADAATDRDRLARDAHAMIAAGGALGFAQLAALCREVELACAAGADHEDLLVRLRDLARATLVEIEALRAA